MHRTMMDWLIFIGLLVCHLCIRYAESTGPAHRLPTNLTPHSYFLYLEPHMDTNSVSGSVTIKFLTTSNQSEMLTDITLHMGVNSAVKEDSVVLLEASGKIRNYGGVEYDDAHTLLKVVLPEGESLEYDQMYVINLKFFSPLNTEPTGLFSGSFNSTSKYIASNFRPTFARNVFPCFDEPQFKTPVTLHVRRPLNYFTVSTATFNQSETKNDGMVLDTFKETSPISIHSLGLFISQLTPVESPMGVKLYAAPGTATSVPFLKSMLDSVRATVGPFPVTPLNLILLPDQMELHIASFGLVFTSIDIYGYNEHNPSFAAHVWGSLQLRLAKAFLLQFLEFCKTPEWWSHMWLSEGVGTFLASHLLPEVLPWLQIETRSESLGLDYPTPPVIDSQILSHWEIQKAVVDQQVRNKGFAVLLLWNNTLWEGAVIKTIADYIKIHKSVVTTDDFLSVLVSNIKDNITYNGTAAVEGLPLWLNTTGYPTVTYLPKYNDSSFQLTQEPENCGASKYFWPLSISIAQNNYQDWNNYRWGLWFLNSSSSFRPRTFVGKQWAVLNLEAGLYRVDYNESWELIQNALKVDLLPSNTPDSVRATIQDDAISLSFQGKLPFSTAFSVLKLTQRHKFDWFPVSKAFEAISNQIGNDKETYENFGMFARTLFSKDLLAALDLHNKPLDPSMQYVRSIITPWLCNFNIGNCREEIIILYDQLLRGEIDKIDPGDLENVACYGARFSNYTMDHLVSAYVTSATQLRLRQLYTIGLGCISDTISVSKLLGLIVNSSSPLAISDTKKIIVSLSSNVVNSDTITDFIYNQASTIQSMLGSGCLGEIILTIGKLRVDMSKIQALVNDPRTMLDSYVIQTVIKVINRTSTNQAWWSAHSTDLETSLPDHHGKKKTTTRKPTTSTTTSTASSSLSSASTGSSQSASSTSSTPLTPTTSLPSTPSPPTTTPSPPPTVTPSSTSPYTQPPTLSTLTTTYLVPTTTTPTSETTSNVTGTSTNPTTTTIVTSEISTAATNISTTLQPTTNGTTLIPTPATHESTTPKGSTYAPSSCLKSVSNVKLFSITLYSVAFLLISNS